MSIRSAYGARCLRDMRAARPFSCAEKGGSMEDYTGNPAHVRAIDMHDKRLDAHSADIHEMQKLLVKLTQIEKQNQERINAMEQRIAEIEARPARRWDTLVVAVLTTLAGGLGGYLLAGAGLA